jgi:hypothetical protein
VHGPGYPYPASDTSHRIRIDCGDGEFYRNGTISAIDFASFGTPAGRCGNFTVDPACNAKSSLAIVKQLCIGKRYLPGYCEFNDSKTLFGEGDPCPQVAKHMAVQAKCTGGEAKIMQLNLTVPFGAEATLHLPATVPPSAGGISDITSATTTIYERGTLFLRNGRFFPVAGVTPLLSEHLSTDRQRDDGVISSVVLGGTYSFDVWAPAAAAGQ